MGGFVQKTFGSKAEEKSNDPAWIQAAADDVYKRAQTIADQHTILHDIVTSRCFTGALNNDCTRKCLGWHRISC